MGFIDRLRGNPTESDFAAMLRRALRRAGDKHELRYEPADSRVLRLIDGKPVGVINLSNMYRSYMAKPRAEREAFLKTCVRGALTYVRELPDDFDSARPDLRPKIWSRAGLEKQRLRGKIDGMGDGPDLPSIPIGDHLLACVAFDWPDSTQSISDADLERWEVSVYEALEVARENLAETTNSYAKIGEGVYSFITGDSYDACRLLLVDRIRDFELAGRPVAVLPNRDTVLITGEDDVDGLGALAAVASEQLQENYRLSGVPLVLEGDEWVDWMPPEGHPHLDAFRNLEVKFLWPEYKEQKEWLEKLNERDGVDVYVATYNAIQKPETGRLVSYCVWGDGVDFLLPVARKVVFARLGQEGFVAVGEWERVIELAGDLLEETDLCPRRYRVRGFPDDAVLAEIGMGEI